MGKFNLNNLFHRQLDYTISFPDGTSQTTKYPCEIPVRIPKIQRDYAEGRETSTIENKRHSLLSDMLDVVYGVKNCLSFDFVYGYMRDKNGTCSIKNWNDLKQHPGIAFEPLDGQQRLTTLFLLHWLFDRARDLQSQTNHSLFVYETRDTSEEFCNWLVCQNSVKIITGWLREVNIVNWKNKRNKDKWYKVKNSKNVVDPIENRLLYPLTSIPTLFEYIQSLDSFKWDWHDDPNIHSMIVVLEATIQCIQERGLSYICGVKNKSNLDNITFMLLDDLDCDGDQLFEKMNARGKALTSYEILKSSLEEEMEMQGLSSTSLGNNWRNDIDSKWIDYCWDSSNIGQNPNLQTVRNVELKLERLLIRMVGKSFFATNIVGTPTKSIDAKDYTALFYNSISKRDSVNDVIVCYFEYARHERAVGNNSFAKLDFKQVYDDLSNLLYQDSNAKWHDASQLLPNYNLGNNNTLLDEFTADSITHNIRVMIYAMLAYLRIVPAHNIANNSIEKDNFLDWMRFIRNVYNAANKNSGLDNFDDVKTAIIAIDNWMNEYKNNYYRNKTSKEILSLIFNYIAYNSLSQEQARLEEEKLKADLRLNGSGGFNATDWEKSILNAENNPYLWGQIISPLSWSYNGSQYDKTLFDDYVNWLNKIFTCSPIDGTETDIMITQAMLCYQDFRHNCNNNLGSLGRFNNNRDYSWKQYLRKKDSQTGFYGFLFKRLIDDWKSPAYSSLSFTDYLRNLITNNKSSISIQDWRYYIINIQNPNTLLTHFKNIGTSGRYLFNDPNSGHTYFFKSDTQRTSNRYELLTSYLGIEKRLLLSGVKTSQVFHTADSLGAHVDFYLPNGEIIRLSLGSPGTYNLEKLGSAPIVLQQNIDVTIVESELQKMGVISSL